jgi:membrane-associated phospholipid phosphatase
MDFCYNLIGHPVVDRVMLAVSIFGDGIWIPVSLTVLTALIFLIFKKKRFALAIVLAPLLGNGIKSIIKNVVGRPRPGWEGCQSLVKLSDFSFPSGHTIFYTIYFGLLAWYGYRYLRDFWYGKLLYIFSALMIILVGISRVYIGAHWASDVLAGYVIGGIILGGTIYLLNKYPDKK